MQRLWGGVGSFGFVWICAGGLCRGVNRLSGGVVWSGSLRPRSIRHQKPP